MNSRDPQCNPALEAARRHGRRGATAIGLAGVALLLHAAGAGAQQDGGQQRQLSAHELRCIQLEQELSNDWVRGTQTRDQLPKIETDIRRYNTMYRRAESAAERGNCYQSVFIFGRSLRRTPKCIRLHNRMEDARRQIASLEEQKAALSGRGTDRRRDDLIDALASYGCGQQYQRTTRRRGGLFGWLTDEDDYFDRRRRELETSRIEPFATYRTLCVRTCDGYYFPVSFSTLPSRFSADATRCQQQCAAPAELFVYRNPGETPEQMVSSDGQRAYNDQPNAWKYRKEYVQGCSCKTAEYDPDEIGKSKDKAAGAPPQGGDPPKVAEQKGKAPETR